MATVVTTGEPLTIELSSMSLSYDDDGKCKPSSPSQSECFSDGRGKLVKEVVACSVFHIIYELDRQAVLPQ